MTEPSATLLTARLRPETRLRLARAGDWLFFLLLVLAFVVEVTGGIRVGRGWYRVTPPIRRAVMLAALGVHVIRHLVPRPSVARGLTARARAARRRHRSLSAALRRADVQWLIAIGVLAVATAWLLQDQIAPSPES